MKTKIVRKNEKDIEIKVLFSGETNAKVFIKIQYYEIYIREPSKYHTLLFNFYFFRDFLQKIDEHVYNVILYHFLKKKDKKIDDETISQNFFKTENGEEECNEHNNHLQTFILDRIDVITNSLKDAYLLTIRKNGF